MTEWFDTSGRRPGANTNATSAQLISVDTSHNIQLDRPDVVLDKIHELLR